LHTADNFIIFVCRFSNSGSLKLMVPSGSVQACRVTAFNPGWHKVFQIHIILSFANGRP